jgi:DeoR/GlpR family transcriptional regulator of sugar metabolism
MINSSRLLKSERQSRIRKLLEENGQVTVPEISQVFSVSEVTIRRDLEEMDLQGKLRRTHGGAISMHSPSTADVILERFDEQSNEKQRIGRVAAQSLRDYETVFLGSGSTVLEIARHIPADKRLTVITNSLPVVNELARHPYINMIIIGGSFRKDEQSFTGYVTEQSLREFRADRVFMGIRSIDPSQGLTNEYFPESSIARELFNIAPKVIVVADRSKFGRVSPVFVAPVTAIHQLFTDSGAPQAMVSAIQSLGIPVILA